MGVGCNLALAHFLADGLRPRDFALRPQLLHDVLRHVRRNGEADADIAAGLRQNLRVDADELSARVHQRAARIPVIDWRVGLEKILVAAVANAGGPSLAADDAHGDSLPDAERVAHGQHDIADLHLVGIAESNGLQPRAVHLEQGQVARLVRADQLCRQRSAVAGFDLDLIGAVHDMEVRENVAVGRRDDARAERPLFEGARTAPAARIEAELIPEEPAQQIVIRQLEAGGRHPGFTLGVDRDHRWRDDVDDVGV